MRAAGRGTGHPGETVQGRGAPPLGYFSLQPDAPALAGQGRRHEDAAVRLLRHAIARGAQLQNGDLEFPPAHGPAGTSRSRRRRSPLARSTTSRNWPSAGLRPSSRSCPPAVATCVISPPAGSATVPGSAMVTAGWSCAETPLRLTSSQISVAVPATMSRPATTTNNLTALSTESDIAAIGEAAFGPIELAADVADEGRRLGLFLAG